jgi:Leucine-rich repeat (LRR) protein
LKDLKTSVKSKKMKMKITIVFLFFGACFSTFAQSLYTSIPDAHFEAQLQALKIDVGTIDGKVLTNRIAKLKNLDISNSHILDLTGIEGFKSLENLDCSNNLVVLLDVSKNNALKTLNVNRNKLKILDLSQNTRLKVLKCAFNALEYLNLKNGNNRHFKVQELNFKNNPYLNCLQVDDACYANSYWNNKKDASASYATDCEKYTAIPDAAFETKLIALGLDIAPLDGKISTRKIETVLTLDVYFSGIEDLTGIEDFTALKELNCSSNQLTQLDVSKNTALEVLNCETNQITSLNVSNNRQLTNLNCSDNLFSVLDLSNNEAMQHFFCYFTQLTQLDLSKNTNLIDTDCSHNTQLTSLNLKNGNNTRLNPLLIVFTDNPRLGCITVDDVTYANANWNNINIKDNPTLYSETCTTSNSSLFFDQMTLYPNPLKGELHIDNVVLEKVSIYNAMGYLENSYFFDNKASTRTLQLTGLQQGIYYFYLQSQGSTTVRIIKIE